MTPELSIRPALPEDCPAIARLISLSARELGANDHPPDAVEAALRSGAWGLDRQLIADRTYYLVLVGKDLAACGGWSFRRTLYGADDGQARSAERLDPARDSARIRAFFVNPRYARRGLASLLLACCEKAAGLGGFRSLELAATVGGEHLYRANGYTGSEHIEYAVGDGLTLKGVLMAKRICRRQGQNTTGTRSEFHG